MSAQTTLSDFSGVLVTIHSDKSYFEVTEAIESKLQRFSITKQLEYMTHANREGFESYVTRITAPSNYTIFFDLNRAQRFNSPIRRGRSAGARGRQCERSEQ